MQTILYPTAGNIPPKKSFNASLCAENRLNLLPEHIAQIGQAFILQLSLAQLTSRDVRILSAIYSQTIGYDKREDDMSGTRLEQLTAIRHDHANDSVRRLESLNIILTREGHYGKWMSVNFDFKHWGKDFSELATNDPRCLLSAVYQSPMPDETLEFQLHVLPKSKEKESTLMIQSDKNAVPPAPVSPSESTPSPVKPPLSATDEAKLQEKPEAEPKEEDSFKLHFPPSFSDRLRQLITSHLASFKIPQQAQRLLDYFAQCLKKGKIRDPMAYFVGLKKRWLAGTLDLGGHDQQPASATVEDKTKQQRKIEQRTAYQSAVADVEQLKKIIKMISTEQHCTFEEALKKIQYTAIWEKAMACLEQTRKAYYPT